MEFVELFKLLSDQADKADTQAQIETIKELIGIVHYETTLTWWTFTGIMVIWMVIFIFCGWYLDRKIKKLELLTSLKES